MSGAALVLVGVWLVLQGLVGGLAGRLLALANSPITPPEAGKGGGFTGDNTTPTAGGGGGGGAW